MAEEMSFAEMFKRMVDRNIEPDPRRARSALETILRQLTASPATSPGHDPPGPKRSPAPPTPNKHNRI